MLGCGYNHSIAITNDGGVKVWGSSKNNELGVVDLYGFEQLKPFDLITRIDDIEYKATQVACGESHSLILVQDKNQLPLKLVYSGEIDLNYFFQIIIQYIQDYYQSFEQYHAQQQKEEFSREDVWTLIRDAIPPSHHDIVNTLVDILLEHSHKGSDKIDYKELRDQLYGKRLDSGRVLQWLHPLDVGEEIQDKDKLKPKKVEFPVAEIVTMVACGSSHCMAVAGAKQLYTWGLNSHGQLGLGDTVNRVEPVKITSIPGEGIMDVGGGSAHSAVLLANGMIYTWGLGANGRLGHGSENSKLEPTKLEIRDIVSLAVGHSHTGAVANTQVFTWGNGSYGRLGHGNQDDQMLPTPIVEFAGKSVRKLVFSVFHSMAIICNGEVWGWGNANDGRLGVDAGNEEKQLIPRKVGTGTALSGYDIIDVALGLKHAIAVANNGGMFAWGDTEAGKLGLGAVGVSKIMVPVKIPEINLGQGIIKEHKQRNMPILSTSIYNIQCGDYNTFVLTDSGELLVTGGNDKGQLGVEVEPAEMDDDEPEQLENGHMDYEYEPLKVQSVKRGKDAYKFMFIKPSNYGNVDRISNISLAGQSMFAISTSGSVYAWGNNGDGQLGIGYQSENFQEIPITIKSLSRLRASKVACGPHHTAFVMASGEVFVCGNSEDGKLGIGPSILEMSDHSQYLPRMLSSVPIISKISCGYTHTAAIDLNGGVWVWGSGWSGKLGTGNTETYYEPYNVKLESFAPDPSGKLVKIACGEDHTVVVTSDGFVYSAGIAKYAGHRRSNMNISIRYFTLISDVEEKISKIAVGRNHSIAITVSGNTYGWGETRYSKLGAGPFKEDPDDKDITYPTILHTGTALITKASCGPNHTACIASDGAIVVWGSTLKGRLGIGEPYKKSKKEESRSDKKITEVPVPLVLAGLQRWLLENKKKIKKEVSAPSAQDEKYVLQGLLENEGANQKHETLLSDLTKLKTQLINILDQYKELYDIEVKKQILMNQFESVLVAQNSINPKLVNPEYELTLPPFISKNIQLYEFLIASLQYHPCYLSYIVEKNPNLAATETSGLIESIFGDLEENQRLIRLLMGLHRMIIKSSVARSDFKQALQVKAGDLSAHIYNYILSSQPQNLQFLATIAVEIIQRIHKYAFRNNPLGIAAQNTQYIRDLEVKEEHKEQSEKREKNFDLCMDEILQLITGAMQNQPEYRKMFQSDSKNNKKIELSNEVKYMFKEVPQVMKHNFPKDSATREGRATIHSKVVALFLLPIIEMLKMPETLRSKAHDQIEKLKDSDQNEIEDWDKFIEQNKSNIWNVAQGLERFSERESNKYDTQLKNIHNSLIDVPEITLRDWFLVDMLGHSLEPTAYRHTMTIKSLLMMYKLISKHKHILEERFPPHDPVIQITKSLGDTDLFIPQLIDIQHSDYKVNLTLPTRWLLREKCLQVCPHCQMTLTTSLLPQQPPDPTAPLSIPLTWRCTNCGNIQTDDNNRCMSCNELRIAFPNNYIFKPFLPLYQDTFLDSFIELLMRIPPIPKNVTIREFLQDMEKNSDETEVELKSMIARFTKSLNKRATKYLQREGDEIIGVYQSPEQRQEMACEEIIRLFEEEAKEEFYNRTAYRSYLDYMTKSLKNIEMRIQLDIAKFNDSYITDIKKSIKKISPETPKEGRSQGRYTAEHLMDEDINVLIKTDLKKPIARSTEFYFIEGNDGSFQVKVIFTERSNKPRCLGGRPNEAQIAQFEIPALKLREMRRTLNSRAITTFGQFTFNVPQLVRLLQKLLGQDLK